MFQSEVVKVDNVVVGSHEVPRRRGAIGIGFVGQTHIDPH